MDMTDSRNSFEQNTTELLHNEIRNVLLRYWRNIDRVRLQFFHIWLIIFSILQIGLINYLMLQTGKVNISIFSLILIIVSSILIWLIYLPIIIKLISLSMDQIILIIIGAIEDANEAADRDNLSLRFNKAVNRQIELQALKDRQDQLLLSVIPAYLTEQVSKTVMKSFDNDDKEIESRNLFHEFHVQYHANVSILFADIVNFTVLAGRLSANELVYTLNELYSKFDQDAQKLQCMRIKFLGDCYYCVSGMPLNRPNHADMCVIMGLEMIKTVKQVRKATGVDVNMRIGVHTGSVLCGVLGLRKWQFDIWSDDVMLANRMETTGTPGAVHITNTTKELLLGQYNIIEAYSNDPILIALGQPTYYILPDETSAINRTTTYNRKMIANDEQNDNLTISQTFKIASFKSKISKVAEYWGAETPFANLSRKSLETDKHFAQNIKRCISVYTNSKTTQSLTLLENNLADYIVNSFFDLLKYTKSMIANKGTPYLLFQFKQKTITNRISDCMILLLFGIPLAISQICLLLAYQPRLLLLQITQILILILSLVLITTIDIYYAFAYRFLITLSFFLTSAIAIGPYLLSIFINDELSSLIWQPGCIVHLAFIFLLHRNLFIYQVILVFVDFLCFIVSLCLFTIAETTTSEKSYNILLISMNLIFEMLLIMFIYWIRNYERNMEIACNASLRDEEKTVEELQNINKNLIENILPSHVAAKLLNSNQLTNKLYAQLHENVCVMFASIPNYEEFWGEWDRSKKFECLRFLNEIVCEFDKLLSELKFRNVEKIKTVASTYLAATGLDEHELIDTYEFIDANEDELCKSKPDYISYRNVILMVEFAMEMNNILRKLNDHSFQNFELRVGLNCGPLIAGVIGAQKPQYDIWGDTVNLASRMDTYGESGKIHMTKAVGQLLQQSSLPVTSRGFMKVKGVAEPIETFFLEFKSAGVLAKNCTNYLC
ncbi:Adenylate cyclase type [Dirofilaria immitis]